MLAQRHSPQQSPATEITHDNAVVTLRDHTTYYNSWMSKHSGRQIDGTDADRLERLRSLSPDVGDSASEESSGSVLSSSSYENLDAEHPDAGHVTEFGEQRFISTSPTANDCQSLVSVTPDVDSLSTTSTGSSPVSDVDDSLSDTASLYNNKEHAWSWTRSRRRSAGNDFVVRRRHRNDRRVVDDEHDLPVDDRESDAAEYHTFDGKEIATIRMLELELLAADLSKQMTSMHKLMRLLSCETSQLANLIDDERRHGVRTTVRKERLGGQLSSDNEELAVDGKATVEDESGDDVSTQKVLLSAVIDELKSVSMMMSNTLESVTASRSPSTSILTAHDSVATNIDDNNYDNNKTESDEACQFPTADSHDQQCKTLSAAETDDDDDDNDTCTTEVSAFLQTVA